MPIRSLYLPIWAGFLVLNTTSIGVAADRNQTIGQALEGMKLEKDEMAAMRDSQMNTGKSDLGNHAWIPLKTCKGSLVIYMSRHNRYLGMRTTGDCTMEDLKAR